MTNRLRTRCLIAVLGCLLLAGSMHAGARQAPAGTHHVERPKIGLVLSGGGARGYAHVGVLKYLEEHRIPVDLIAGTSVGALVGGLYASGMTAAELESRLAAINLTDIAYERRNRTEREQAVREDERQYPLVWAMGYGNGHFKMPSALLQGTGMLMLLQDWTARIPDDIRFDALPIPFGAVAADLSDGREVLMTQGNLPYAMRASMAVPGLFSPVLLDGNMLVDGGLSSNLPVQEARLMGADIVIAVDISIPLKAPEDIHSSLDIVQQSLKIMIQRNVIMNRDSLRQQDVLIHPDVEDVGFLDFSASEPGIATGTVAARKQHAMLAHLSLPEKEWLAHLQARRQRLEALRLPQEIRIDEIRIATIGQRIPADIIRHQLTFAAGDIYDAGAINRNLAYIADNQGYARITHELREDQGRNQVFITAEEKNWGPHFFSFGFGFISHMNGNGFFTLKAGHRLPWINDQGMEWRNDVVISTSQGSLVSEMRQPLWRFVNSKVYLAPYIELSRTIENYYSDRTDSSSNKSSDSTLQGEYSQEKGAAGIRLGIALGQYGDLRISGSVQRARMPTFTDNNTTRHDIHSQPILAARLVIDQLDAPVNPSQGYYMSATAKHGGGRHASRYEQYAASGLVAASLGSHTLAFKLDGGYTSNRQDRVDTLFTLGGTSFMPAFPAQRFVGDRLIHMGLDYRFNFKKPLLPMLDKNIVGLSLERARLWHTSTTGKHGRYLNGITAYAGGTSVVGPVNIGISRILQADWNAYIQVGYPF